MKKLFLFKYFIAGTCFIASIKASNYVLINCSWPCPNLEQGCVVTSTGASCGNRDSNLWIINKPEKSPFYTGAYISINLQPCQPVPIPSLPIVSPANKSNATTANMGESIIQWPIMSLCRPQDEYLGNCGHGLYCSSTGQDRLNPVCRQRIGISSPCQSSNQCISKYCLDGTCQLLSDNTTATERENGSGRTQHHHNYNMHPTHNATGHILAAVFGVFGAMIVAAFGFIYYRKRKNDNNNKNNQSESIILPPQESMNITTNSFMSMTNTSDNNALVQKQFASDFQQEHIATPAMQQRHLQQSMRHQNNNIDDYRKPPPSYTP